MVAYVTVLIKIPNTWGWNVPRTNIQCLCSTYSSLYIISNKPEAKSNPLKYRCSLHWVAAGLWFHTTWLQCLAPYQRYVRDFHHWQIKTASLFVFCIKCCSGNNGFCEWDILEGNILSVSDIHFTVLHAILQEWICPSLNEITKKIFSISFTNVFSMLSSWLHALL